MSDAQHRGPRGFDARREERLPASVCIYLVSLPDPRASERTNTENVSYHGARVISKWSWRSDEESIVTPPNGGIADSRKSDLLFAKGGKLLFCWHGIPESQG